MAQGLFNLKQVNQAIQQGAWTTGIKPPSVDYLVVAGGGGCGTVGGGGGGGLLNGSCPVTSGSALTVTVGAGGATGTIGASSQFSQIIAIGGGGLGTNSGLGGSGAGGNHSGTLLGGPAVGVQGNSGGNNTSGTTFSGAGGGAGSAGLDSFNGAGGGGGDGGQGVALPISGTMTAYSGGGGGSGSGTQGLGGAGGGGNAVSNASGNANSGTANTGGGSGGSYAVSGGTGGSGIVIVSYPDVYAAATATTGSPTVSTSGSGSLSFNGTSQYLQYANNAAYNLGTGSFTIEAFVYISNFANNRYIGVQANPSTLAAGWGLAVRAASNIIFYMNASAVLTSTTLSTNTWYHVAVVRNGTAMAMYIDGTLVASGTSSANIDYGGDLGVGAETSAANYFSGNISNFRIVKGTAVYTAAFAPLTAPLTPVSGTGILLNTVSGAYLVDSSSNAFRPTVYNSVAWNQLSPFATGSGYKNRVYRWTSSGSITF